MSGRWVWVRENVCTLADRNAIYKRVNERERKTPTNHLQMFQVSKRWPQVKKTYAGQRVRMPLNELS